MRSLVLPLIAAAAAGCAERPASKAADPTARDSGTIQLDQATVPFLAEGAGRPCLVFGSHIYYPRTFSERFKSQLRCVHFDQRGFIPTAGPPSGGRYSVAQAVADIDSVRAALGLDRFVMVGHSMHGTVALAYGLAHPEHVLGVVAIGAPPAFDSTLTAASDAYWEAEASPGRKAADQTHTAALTPDALARMSSGERLITSYIANRARYWADSSYDASWLWKDMSGTDLIFQLFDFGNPYRLGTTPQENAPPAFVAVGRFDFVVPPTLWEGRSSPFASLTLRVFERSGHTPQLEEQDAFDASLEAWLATLPSR